MEAIALQNIALAINNLNSTLNDIGILLIFFVIIFSFKKMSK